MRGVVKLVSLTCALIFLGAHVVVGGLFPVEHIKEVNTGGHLRIHRFHADVYLFWESPNFLGAAGISLEYSVDAVHWQSIDVDCRDMKPENGVKFQFVDKRRNIGRNFYRVCVIDQGKRWYSNMVDIYHKDVDGPIALRSCSAYSFSFSLDKSIGRMARSVSLIDEDGHSLGCTLQENKGLYTIRVEETRPLRGNYTLKFRTEKGLFTAQIPVN